MNSFAFEESDEEDKKNIGQRWTGKEENKLLQELDNNIDIEKIAKNHKRTVVGINSRRREIAYKMYLKNIPIEEIVEKTKLENDIIQETILKREKFSKRKTKEVEYLDITELTDLHPNHTEQNYTQQNFSEIDSIKNDIEEIKCEIKHIKYSIKELVAVMKSIYDFENK